VTNLIIERGFLQKTNRVLPISAVQRTTEDEIYLSTSLSALDEYPEYKKVKFVQPAANWQSEQYGADHVMHWSGRYGMLYNEPTVPRTRCQVHQGVAPLKEIIEKGTPVRNAEKTLGKVDHVLVNRDNGEITHLVLRRGIIPSYPVLPISKVKNISEKDVYVSASEEEIKKLPHYTPREDESILVELQHELQAAAADLQDVKAKVDQGVVRLTGLVEDVTAKRQAEAAARSVQGVIDVKNELDTDINIATKVNEALLDDPRTHMAVIQVVSENGVVTLKGQVDNARVRKAAQEVAEKQPGVISVVNALEVQPDQETESLGPWDMDELVLDEEPEVVVSQR
jgi:osmotically-inducible protein OsmY